MTIAEPIDAHRIAGAGTDAAARRAVSLWLWFVAALIVAMVIVGGATRLTESGLSITEWQPLLGAIPPLNHADWLSAFEKYKQIPK
jgi:cytochrome c oxidase assembly protein subunit 15